MLLLELHYLQPLKLVGLVVGPVGLVVGLLVGVVERVVAAEVVLSM